MAQQVKNPTSNHEDAGLSPGLTQWVKDPVLLHAAVYVAVAVVQAHSCSSAWTPLLGTPIRSGYGP